MSEALFYANALEVSDKNPALINVNNRAAAELRRLHDEHAQLGQALKRAIERINELEALNAELAEALRHLRNVLPDERWADDSRRVAEAALAKVGDNK